MDTGPNANSSASSQAAQLQHRRSVFHYKDELYGKHTRMIADFNAECGPDAPVLEVPWASPDGALHYTDLRDDPDALDAIAEADEHPALLNALRVLNSSRSAVFTAKCDVWPMDADELAATRAELMLDDEVATAGIASYIDIVWRERAIFTSSHRTEQAVQRFLRVASTLPHTLALLDCTLRPAVVDLDSSVAEGFSVTLYVKGVGVDAAEANERWSDALRDTASLLRS